MTREDLKSELHAAIKKFVDYRNTHGGIMLPTNTIIDGVYNEVMIELEQRPEPKKYHIFGQNNQ